MKIQGCEVPKFFLLISKYHTWSQRWLGLEGAPGGNLVQPPAQISVS